MMMYAYNELYLDDAMCSMGEMYDYAICDCQLSRDTFFDVFITSHICHQFEKGNPKYITGKSGVELAREVWRQMTGEKLTKDPSCRLDRSMEYWAGWSLAYYQWYRNESFQSLSDKGLNLSKTISMYILHEADVTKFVDAADQIIEVHVCNEGERLKRLRRYYGYTQKELSRNSGVTLRMIQLYEQGQNDLSKAQAHVVQALAETLNCKIEDLINLRDFSLQKKRNRI